MLRALLASGLAVIFLGSTFAVMYDDKPKYTNKEVMAKANKKGALLEKVLAGNASDKEKDQLVEYYTALSQNAPKKGDAEAYKKLATANLDAAKAIKNGDKDGIASLKKASNCKSCHDAHK